MKTEEGKLNILENLSWSFLFRILGNINSFIIYLLLARLLEPNDFGILATLAVFINFLNLFATAGLSSANIQSQTSDDERYATLFYATLIVSFLLYIVIFILSPYIVDAFRLPDETITTLRIYGLTIVITGVNAIQTSELSRRLYFKKIFIISTLGSITSGVVSIYLAFIGFGIYALISNVALTGLISIIVCSIFFIKFPRFKYNIGIHRSAMSFSGNIFFANLLVELHRSIPIITIGKVSGSEVLGYFQLGRQIPTLVFATLNASAATVLFPTFTKLQSDISKARSLLRTTNRIMSVVLFPVASLTVLLAEEVISVLMSEKWLSSAIYLQFFVLIGAIHHISNNAIYLLNALGLSSTSLYYEVIKKSLGFVLIFGAFSFGLTWVMWALLLDAIISLIITVFPAKKYLGYLYSEQLVDTLPVLICNAAVVGILWIFDYRVTSDIFTIAINFAFFTAMYSLAIILFQPLVYQDLKTFYIRYISVYFRSSKIAGSSR